MRQLVETLCDNLAQRWREWRTRRQTLVQKWRAVWGVPTPD